MNSKLFEKYQRFNAVGGSIGMLKNGWIFKNFSWNDNLKHFACPKQRAAWRKLFIPQQIKASYVFGRNIFWWRFIGINRHLISKCFENAVLAGLEMVQWKCFF